jgi:hypothetical protein
MAHRLQLFKFFYVHEITDKNTFPYPATRTYQAKDFYTIAKKFKNNCIGYDATAWSGWTTPAPKCFDSIEFLYQLNAADLPSKDYR